MKICALMLALTCSALAHEGHSSSAALKEMSATAKLFLASLDDEKKKLAHFSFGDDERENWHYFPMVRGGVRFGHLNEEQKKLALNLVSTGLSEQGLTIAKQVMSLEQILRDQGGDPEHRDPDKYYLAIFGDPGGEKPWGWRFEGHHLSLNYTVPEGHLASKPMFFGTNPAEVLDGPHKGLRPLGVLEDEARQLAVALKEAGLDPVFTERPPREILTAQKRTAEAQKVAGATSDKMSREQLQHLFKVIEGIAGLQEKQISKTTLKKIKSAQRRKIHFAWGGSLEPRSPHYFRIQGTDFLIEYANTQNNANHAHLVWRDLKNDFGRDLLKEHYETHHE